MSYLTRNKLLKLGFAKVGEDVFISDKCSIYSPQNISIGNNVRVDDFCIISASKEIVIGDNVHIACHSSLLGNALIELEDFSGVSIGCTILSSNADYSGKFMTNPNIDEKYLNTHSAPVVLGKHSLVGCGSVILPGVSLGQGAVIGANSLVKESVPDFEIWCGSPVKKVKNRFKDILKLEKQMNHG